MTKVYLLAGDYHLDMIRMAWVLYVNKTMFNRNAKALDLGADDVSGFYQYVLAGVWDYDMMTSLCRKIWQDTGKVKDRADADDGRVGFVINDSLYSVFVPSTGLSIIYTDEGETPKVIESIDEINRMGNKIRTIYSHGPADGIYYGDSADISAAFCGGNVLFAPLMLGELADEELIGVSFEKAVLPVPKYDNERQEHYHTHIDGEADASIIVITTKSFAVASAFLQYATELSGDVAKTYYVSALKLAYDEDPNVRALVDLVRAGVDDSAFGSHFAAAAFAHSTCKDKPSNENFYDALSKNSISSYYDGWKGAYQAALNEAITAFSQIP